MKRPESSMKKLIVCCLRSERERGEGEGKMKNQMRFK